MSSDLDTLSPMTQNWAASLKRRGLSAPTILLLEAHKPFSFVLSQWMILGQPLLSLFMSTQFTETAIHLFSDRQRLEQFIQTLEQD